MQFNGKVITTPYESSTRYDPFWRVEVAKTWATTHQAPEERLADDKWIKEYADYLRNIGGVALPKRLQKYATVLSWYGGSDIHDEKCWLEPLLLTNVSYDVIAADMGDGLDPETVEAYEKLCFNIRDEHGKLSTSCYKRAMFAQPRSFGTNRQTPEEILWRVLGNQYGYRMLVNYWKWGNNAHGPDEDEDYVLRELSRMMQTAMQMRILRGDVNNLDLNNFFGQYTQWVRMQRESSHSLGGVTPAHETVLNILSLYRPKLISSAKTVDEKKKIMEALQAKMLTDTNIASQVVRDMGPEEGLKYITELQDKNFRSEQK